MCRIRWWSTEPILFFFPGLWRWPYTLWINSSSSCKMHKGPQQIQSSEMLQTSRDQEGLVENLFCMSIDFLPVIGCFLHNLKSPPLERQWLMYTQNDLMLQWEQPSLNIHQSNVLFYIKNWILKKCNTKTHNKVVRHSISIKSFCIYTKVMAHGMACHNPL